MLPYYAEFIKERVENGWEPYLLTFTFRQLDRRNGPVREQMEDAIKAFYSKLITRLIRKPRSTKSMNQMPVMLASLDRPVPKRDKCGIRDVTVNGGLHGHGLIAIHPSKRISESLDDHIAKNPQTYLGNQPWLRAIDVRPIISDVAYTTGYALKGVGSVPDAEILVLPKSVSELANKADAPQRGRTIKDIQSCTNFSDELAHELAELAIQIQDLRPSKRKNCNSSISRLLRVVGNERAFWATWMGTQSH